MAENASKKKPGFFSKVKTWFSNRAKYFRDTKSEMKKVVWPTKKQVINNTIVVLIVVAVCALVILLLDALFGFLMGLLVHLMA